MLFQMPSVTWSASSSDTSPTKDLPKAVRGRIPHVVRFVFETDFTPTYTTAPTTVGNNSLVTRCDFFDGKINRFEGGFNHLRAHERINNGRNRVADADTDLASTNARYFRRILHCGPPQMAGGLDYGGTDFAIPTGVLVNGELRWGFGALTDLSADTTAATGSIKPFADIIVLDEIRIPPAYQFIRISANAADVPIPGESAYVSLSMLNSASFDAVSAGDFSDIQLDLGTGDVVPAAPAEMLQAAYHDDFRTGALEGFTGEIRGAGDDNVKMVNRGTPTALVAASADLQAVLWAKPGKKISKLDISETGARLRWNGSQTSAVILVGRILAQTPTVLGDLATSALASIKRENKGQKVKTLSKQTYRGPAGKYMPYTVKV